MGLTKTVFNPAALKAAQKTTEEAMRKKQVRGGMQGTVGKVWKHSDKFATPGLLKMCERGVDEIGCKQVI